MEKGYVQVYTGNGKGKTTAALGLCLRAAGAGMRVFVAQFLKSGDYSEIKALARFSELVTIKQYGMGRFVKGKPTEEEVASGRRGLAEAEQALLSGAYDVVVLEEANVAAYFGLFPVSGLLSLMAKKPEGVELVITGRNAAPEVMEAADLVTEMREIKHYYQKGVQARVGIEK
ncbi:MAG: cob(I)yrinic acid a,c-diamide adenosyltransferase [Thermodesulfobacteriota bacterium]